MTIRAYLRRLAISVDQLANTVCCGDPDETISSRVGRAALAGDPWARWIERAIDWLFERLGEAPGHCRRSIEDLACRRP